MYLNRPQNRLHKSAFALLTMVLLVSAGQPAETGPMPQRPPGGGTVIVTLGTAGGPPPREDRSQAANMLIVNGTPYLIDAGENAIRQIQRAGIDFTRVGHVFVTHNHSDHTLGLPALLATQWELQRREPVLVHGPPGTRAMVDGLLAFLSVNTAIRRSESTPAPIDTLIRAHEPGPGIVHRDANVTVTAVENNHYNFGRGTPAFGRHKSYAYRFDTPGRSVVFTGDTGFSPAVVRLARGADVLVTEVLAADELASFYRRNGRWARKTPKEQATWLRHQQEEHLSPQAVAQMATAAGVKQVVLTHLPPVGIPGDDYARWATEVRRGFSGEVVVAQDLDRF